MDHPLFMAETSLPGGRLLVTANMPSTADRAWHTLKGLGAVPCLMHVNASSAVGAGESGCSLRQTRCFSFTGTRIQTRTVRSMEPAERIILFAGAGPGDPELLTLKEKSPRGGGSRAVRGQPGEQGKFSPSAGHVVKEEDSSGLSLEGAGNAHGGSSREEKTLFGSIPATRVSSVRSPNRRGCLRNSAVPSGLFRGVSGVFRRPLRIGDPVHCTRRQPDGDLHPEIRPDSVPPREDLKLLAAAGTTMVIFLSADQASEVVSDLTAGGISPDTPSACVYRASWEDEMILTAPLSELPALMAEHGITRHALIIAGQCLADHSARSLLYSPSFGHGYRESLS